MEKRTALAMAAVIMHKEGKRIGLAFAAQRFAEELPTEETDVPLDAVITENGWEE